MNALHTVRLTDRSPSIELSRAPLAPITASRPPRRERDYGVGYGASSGYAGRRPYIVDRGLRPFRCA